MDEEAKKRKLQFRYRRDIGENTNIASLPPGLVEAAKSMLKDDKPEKIEIKGGKGRHNHVNLAPQDDSNAAGMHIRREDIETMVGNLIDGGFSDDEIISVISETIDEGVRLRALGDMLGVTKKSTSNYNSSRFSRLMDTLGHTAIQAGMGATVGASYGGGVKGALAGAAGAAAFGNYLNYKDQKKHRKNVESNLKAAGIKEETLTEMRLMATHTSADGKKVAKVCRKSETGEWVVKHHVDGKYQPKADYFTQDKDDAHDTAKYWVNKS